MILKRVEEEGREEIKKRNVNGDTPLHIAAMEGKVALLRFFFFFFFFFSNYLFIDFVK